MIDFKFFIVFFFNLFYIQSKFNDNILLIIKLLGFNIKSVPKATKMLCDNQKYVVSIKNLLLF